MMYIIAAGLIGGTAYYLVRMEQLKPKPLTTVVGNSFVGRPPGAIETRQNPIVAVQSDPDPAYGAPRVRVTRSNGYQQHIYTQGGLIPERYYQ